MNETTITWNFKNWLTVTLMAFVAFMVAGAVVGFVKKPGVSGDPQLGPVE